MRKYTQSIIFSKNFSLKEKFFFLGLPDPYLADSVDDFNNYRMSEQRLRYERNHHSGRDNISYITVILTDVTLMPASDDDNNCVLLTNEYGEQSHLFLLKANKEIRNATNYSCVLWPQYAESKPARQKMLEKYLEAPADLRGIFLCYDLCYDNAFIMNAVEKGMKSIEDIIKEIWPTR
jgi:hypothetical protein